MPAKEMTMILRLLLAPFALVAALFALLASAALAYQDYKVLLEAAERARLDLEAMPGPEPASYRTLEPIAEEQDLEEMFRLAKQNRTL